MIRYLPPPALATIVLAGTIAIIGMIDDSSARNVGWTGEEYCARAIATLPAAVRGHACIDVRTRPRPGAHLPRWVSDDDGSTPNAYVQPSHLL